MNSRRLFGWALGMASACVLLAGCQADSLGAKNTDIKPPSTAVEESYGESGSEITVLLRKGASGLYEGASRDVRDGAALSVGELGAEQVHVKVVDVSSGVAGVPAAVAAAKARNSILLVSYLSADLTAAVATVPAAQRPPLINLAAAAPTGAGNVYNLASDEVDSAVEGQRAAAANGHKKVAVFAEAGGLQASGEVRIADAIRSSGGLLVGFIRYDINDASASDAVAKNKPLLAMADTILILGKTPVVTTIAGAVRASGQTNVAFVGTSAWPKQTYANGSVTGALIATNDPEGTTLIGDRYQRHYNRPLSTEATYGYDAVAIASGLVRSIGPTALNAENLTSKVGFRGVTGLFRFMPNGISEHKMTLYSVSGGKLTALGTAPEVF